MTPHGPPAAEPQSRPLTCDTHAIHGEHLCVTDYVTVELWIAPRGLFRSALSHHAAVTVWRSMLTSITQQQPRLEKIQQRRFLISRCLSSERLPSSGGRSASQPHLSTCVMFRRKAPCPVSDAEKMRPLRGRTRVTVHTGAGTSEARQHNVARKRGEAASDTHVPHLDSIC